MASSVFKEIISKNLTFWQKLKYIFMKIFLIHMIVICLTILKMATQNFFHSYCWINNICICSNDFNKKCYVSLIYIFTFWNLIIIILSKCAIEIGFHNKVNKFIVFCIFYIISFIAVFTYLLLKDEESFEALPMFYLLVGVSILFQIKFLIILKFAILNWLIDILKINGCLFLFVFHYISCKKVLPQLNILIISIFNDEISKNLIKIYQFLYFTHTLPFPNFYYRIIMIIIEKLKICFFSL